MSYEIQGHSNEPVNYGCYLKIYQYYTYML